MRTLQSIKLFSIVLVWLTQFSCSNNVSQTNYKPLIDSLVIVDSNLSKQNDSLYVELQNKLQNDTTSMNAAYWLPRAMYCQIVSQDIYKQIERYTASLKIDNDSLSASSLQSIFYTYKKAVLQIDPEIHEKIHQNVNMVARYYDSLQQVGGGSIKNDLSKKSKIEKLYYLMLTKQNIKHIENSIVKFCDFKASR